MPRPRRKHEQLQDEVVERLLIEGPLGWLELRKRPSGGLWNPASLSEVLKELEVKKEIEKHRRLRHKRGLVYKISDKVLNRLRALVESRSGHELFGELLTIGSALGIYGVALSAVAGVTQARGVTHLGYEPLMLFVGQMVPKALKDASLDDLQRLLNVAIELLNESQKKSLLVRETRMLDSIKEKLAILEELLAGKDLSRR